MIKVNTQFNDPYGMIMMRDGDSLMNSSEFQFRGECPQIKLILVCKSTVSRSEGMIIIWFKGE